MQVNLTVLPGPAPGRHPGRYYDRSKPLAEHQPREKPICATVDRLVVILKQNCSTMRDCFAQTCVFHCFFHDEPSFNSRAPGLCSAHPKTGVCLGAPEYPLTLEITASTPALSP